MSFPPRNQTSGFPHASLDSTTLCIRNAIGLPGNRPKLVFGGWHPKYSVLRAARCRNAPTSSLRPTNRPLLFKPVARNRKADACRCGLGTHSRFTQVPDPTNNHHHQPSGTTTSYILHSVRSPLNFPNPTCAHTTRQFPSAVGPSCRTRVTLHWQSIARYLRLPGSPGTMASPLAP